MAGRTGSTPNHNRGGSMQGVVHLAATATGAHCGEVLRSPADRNASLFQTTCGKCLVVALEVSVTLACAAEIEADETRDHKARRYARECEGRVVAARRALLDLIGRRRNG